MALLFLTILYHKLLPSQFIFHVLFYVAYCNTTVYNLINIVHRKDPNMKSASVNVRINENIKQHAESILEDLGISRAVAIDLFYRQIILHKGLPFDLKLNTPPLSTSDFTPSELENILSRGVEESNNGNGRSAKEFFATLLGE